MGKHTDAVKSLDEFRAPWETEGGTDAEIDKPKLRRFIYNLLTDKAKAQDARDEAQETLTKTEADLEEAKAEAAKANGPDAQRKIDSLQKKVDDLTADIEKRDAEKAEADLRAEVLGDLDPKYAKYVQGSTKEELEKSLEDVKADFGLEGDDPEDPEDPEDRIRTTPRTRTLRNPSDKDSGKGADKEIDFAAVADEILGSGPFR